MAKKAKRELSVIDLYCGVGGFSLGAARAGFNVVGAVDNDPIVLETHKQNFPKTKHLQLNLSNTTGKNLLNKLNLKKIEIDGMIGGPPCQGFSTIGKNKSGDLRNDLFVKFFKLVYEINPDFFICENVPGLLRPKFDKIRSEAFKQVKKDYTLLKPIKVKASDFGVPTSRTRIFFIGFRKKAKFTIDEKNFAPPKRVQKIIVNYALKGLPNKINIITRSGNIGWRKVGAGPNSSFGKRLTGLIPKGVGDKYSIQQLQDKKLVSGCIAPNHNKIIMKRWKSVGVGQIDKISRTVRLDPNGFCPTLRAGTGKDKGSFQSLRPIHPKRDRVITTREAARLQGFPDWFLFHETKWHSFRQIGNSVSPIVSENILRVIFKKLK